MGLRREKRGLNLNALQILDVLRLYRVDVLLLAPEVTLTVLLLKKTVLKDRAEKFAVFLPFLIGVAVYALYRMVSTWSAAPLTEGISDTLEGGFACGSAATLFYAIYEQLRKGKTTVSPISPLLEGVVPEKKRDEAADELQKAKELAGEERLSFVKETILRYADPAPSEEELDALAKLVCAYLDRI